MTPSYSLITGSRSATGSRRFLRTRKPCSSNWDICVSVRPLIVLLRRWRDTLHLLSTVPAAGDALKSSYAAIVKANVCCEINCARMRQVRQDKARFDAFGRSDEQLQKRTRHVTRSVTKHYRPLAATGTHKSRTRTSERARAQQMSTYCCCASSSSRSLR